MLDIAAKLYVINQVCGFVFFALVVLSFIGYVAYKCYIE